MFFFKPCFAGQLQIAFAGESTEEILKSLANNPSLSLAKPINAAGSKITLGNSEWSVGAKGSAVYLDSATLDKTRNCFNVEKKGDGIFYIHVLRITPPNKIEVLASFEISKDSKHCFDPFSQTPIKKFNY